MSAEGISLRDTKAVTMYIKNLGFYDDFMTYTQVKNAELNAKANAEEDENSDGVGRPSLDDGEIENENTAASRDNGTNTADNREQ